MRVDRISKYFPIFFQDWCTSHAQNARQTKGRCWREADPKNGVELTGGTGKLGARLLTVARSKGDSEGEGATAYLT
nr:hypothetical protein TQ38_28730 [Novosphingobium sp. P6W]